VDAIMEDRAMAKFPTEVSESVVVPVPLAAAYAFFWDVIGSSRCIPGLDRCEANGGDVYRFVYEERSTGPVSMCIQYTASYTGNGTDEIRFEGASGPDDNTDVTGLIELERIDADNTRVALTQTLAPDTPVPRLLQGLIKSFVQGEAAKAVGEYLANVTKTLTTARA
jgi:carbon monoxide dehydrogenase subunit G